LKIIFYTWMHYLLTLDLLSVPLHNINLTSFLDSPRYFNFLLLQGCDICEILMLLKIWRDPKSNNIMYRKNLEIRHPPIFRIVYGTWIT
jgi:hypothetical protein